MSEASGGSTTPDRAEDSALAGQTVEKNPSPSAISAIAVAAALGAKGVGAPVGGGGVEATAPQVKTSTDAKLALLESQLAALSLSLKAESAARAQLERDRQQERELTHELLRELKGQRGEPDEERDDRVYLNVHDIADRIAPGLQERPERAAPAKPHLFDISKDHTARLLSDRSYHAGLEEYRLLYCNTFYLSCALKALTETVGASLEVPEDEELIRPILNTLDATESFFRRRLAYVRIKLRATNKDAGYMDWLQTQLYGVTDAGFSGSSEIDKLEKQYFKQYTKQVMQQGAKLAAAGTKVGTGRRRWGKNKDGDTGGDPRGKSPAGGSTGSSGSGAGGKTN